SPIHSHSWTLPPSSAPVIRSPLSSCLALKQTGQTRYRPPACSYRLSRLGRDGQPSQATPVATPLSASRAASLPWNIKVGRPAPAPAPRKAGVPCWGSSRPVLSLITAFPAIAASLSSGTTGPVPALGPTVGKPRAREYRRTTAFRAGG